jgi:sugar phosphate isomerase/epimerase
MENLKLCLFSSTPEVVDLGFIVKVLTGNPQQLVERTVEWGYDGLEFLPDPHNIPDPIPFKHMVDDAGIGLYVVNSGRMAVQDLALIHENDEIRRRSVDAFKRMIDFAAHFKARTALGIARGKGIPNATKEENDAVADGVFRELTQHAEATGVVIMLEAAEPDITSYLNTNAQIMEWVDRINSPCLSVHLDSHQLNGAENSIEEGIKVTRGMATHIHLYDPSRWPPGVIDAEDQLNWPEIIQILRATHMPETGSVVLAPEGDPGPVATKSRDFLRSLLQAKDESNEIR